MPLNSGIVLVGVDKVSKINQRELTYSIFIIIEMGGLLGTGESDTRKEDRSFTTNIAAHQYGDNYVKSTSSNVLTFIPLNILRQFSNIPNIYFLVICILQVIPSVSVTGGKPTTLLPLSFVIITVMIKDAYEEFIRYRKDQVENNRETFILTNGQMRKETWNQIQCGQIITISEDEIIPCDALILATSLPDNKCFIETRSLDGETNLKVRKAPQFKKDKLYHDYQELFSRRYPINMEAPTQSLNNVKGSIEVDGQSYSISLENVLLRGCHLRNCKQVTAVAVYVGSDTKVILNSAKFQAKKSYLMSMIDQIVFAIFVGQIILSLICSLVNMLLENSYADYMKLVTQSVYWVTAASWWLLMTYFVPISLIVTMEMIKLFQGSVIEKDEKGYSKEYDCYIAANNTSINENLGQIKYVFTDKTGTLTKNEMNFKKIVVNGIKYGDIQNISEQDLQRNYPKTNNVRFRDGNFLRAATTDEKIQEALKAIYLCHEIIINKDDKGEGFKYNSSSPDEIALINFAKLSGYELIQEEGPFTRITSRFGRQIETRKFEKLAFLQFSSDRKRMSVLVRDQSNKITLYMKGADSIVEKRLRPGQPDLARTKQFLEEFSIQGLRTLMLAKRNISESQFKSWYSEYMQAKSSIQNREKNLERVYEKLETNMQLLGGTAVEDRLQDEVAETIVMMKKAGIKFFILTGDKKQTAVSIGRSCGLIDRDAKIFSYPEQKIEAEGYKEKVYLLDASEDIKQYPKDILENQTICYRCTPIQKQNIVTHFKQKASGLTLAIGDGANDVNMILAADVGVGVKGKEGTEATRVADIAVGEYRLLAFIVLYYGRQWYRKNTKLVCYNFFKNWYHVASVIAYGAGSFFSAVVIFDIYNYELFNAIYAALPIVIYAIYDEEYNWQQSKILHDIYKPGLNNSEFNNLVYFQNLAMGVLYGLSSIIVVFFVLEDTVLTSDGRTGYMWQSGAVLFFNIIMVTNFRILVFTYRMSWALLISIFGSIFLYWVVYWIQTKTFSDFKLADSFSQEWKTLSIYFIHIVLVFFLIGIEYGYRKYKKLQDKEHRMQQIAKHYKGLVGTLDDVAQYTLQSPRGNYYRQQ